jgi:hypothetical protein
LVLRRCDRHQRLGPSIVTLVAKVRGAKFSCDDVNLEPTK